MAKFLTFLATQWMFLDVVCSTPVNVALNKPIQALFTCGLFGSESYYNHIDTRRADRDRSVENCADVTIHPPSAMVDGDANTKWQTTDVDTFTYRGNFSSPDFPKSTDNLNAVIYIDLNQVR